MNDSATKQRSSNGKALFCPCTDLGNAERFADQHRDRAKFCFHSGSWLVWKGTHWEADTSGEIFRLASRTVRNIYREAAATTDDMLRDKLAKWAKGSESKSRMDAMLSLARSRPGISVSPDDLDSNDMLFNCKTGTVNLVTGVQKKHDPGDLITKCSPVRFDPDATSPRWDRFLDRVFDGDQELIEFVQRVLGMSLTGDAREQFLFLMYGQGANGKSVLLDMLLWLLGRYAGSAAPDLLVAKSHGDHPTEVADLQGKRLVVASEIESGARWRLQTIKRLTGDAMLKARFMRQDFFEFRRTHKLLVVTNTKPRVTEDTEAVWRRMRLIPFNVVIPKPERDPKLMDKLKEESAGIFNWLIKGCIDWQSDGLPEPAAVVEATDEYRAESDPIADFVADCCEIDPDGWTSTGELRQAYEQHCADNGTKPLGKMRLAEALGRHGCHGSRTWQGRGWQGLTLMSWGTMSTHDDDSGLNSSKLPREETNRKDRHGPTCSPNPPADEPSNESAEVGENLSTTGRQETRRPCPRCRAKLVIQAPTVNGWQNLDCVTPGCGHVEPMKVAKVEGVKL